MTKTYTSYTDIHSVTVYVDEDTHDMFVGEASNEDYRLLLEHDDNGTADITVQSITE